MVSKLGMLTPFERMRPHRSLRMWLGTWVLGMSGVCLAASGGDTLCFVVRSQVVHCTLSLSGVLDYVVYDARDLTNDVQAAPHARLL